MWLSTLADPANSLTRSRSDGYSAFPTIDHSDTRTHSHTQSLDLQGLRYGFFFYQFQMPRSCSNVYQRQTGSSNSGGTVLLTFAAARTTASGQFFPLLPSSIWIRGTSARTAKECRGVSDSWQRRAAVKRGFMRAADECARYTEAGLMSLSSALAKWGRSVNRRGYLPLRPRMDLRSAQ